MKLCAFLVATMLAANASAETLNQWLIQQVVADEQRLFKALTQKDGHSLELLRNSKYYVPFFLEPPRNFSFESPKQQTLFEEFALNQASGLLSGGYIYRLTFHHVPRLYAMSAGYWEGGIWRSLELERDFTIEPDQVWEGAKGDYLYATLLAGVRPRLLVYDQRGEMKQQEVFDASAVDFERRLDAALKPYSRNDKPVLEMISLTEYLKNQNAPWRAVDTSGQFNLRNQQQRPDEQERLKRTGELTRIAAINLLQPTQQSTPSPLPSAPEAPMTRVPIAAPIASPQPATRAAQLPAASADPKPPVWPWVVGIAALIAILALVFKRRA